MDLNASQLAFLRRLVNEQPSHRVSGTISNGLATNFGIGVHAGRQVQYTQAHIQRATQLMQAGGYTTEAPSPLASRAEAHGQPNISEKSGARTPDASTVLIKPLAGHCTLHGQALWAPDGGYLGVTPGDAAAVQCDVAMLVENLETFRYLHDYRWIDTQGKAVLAIWRGDKDRHIGEALNALGAHAGTGQIWCFMDFDPAGLGMADAVHRRFGLHRLVLPAAHDLERVTRAHDQRFLYAQQVGQYARSLDESLHPGIQSSWSLMRGMQIGLAQEMLSSQAIQPPR